MNLLEWKQEPVSPLGSEEAFLNEDVDFYKSISDYTNEKVDLELVSLETKAEVATKLLDDLEQLGNLDEFIKDDLDEFIKNEPFSNWLEEGKIFDAIEVACSTSLPVPQVTSVASSNLWQEFENALYSMPQGALTPPQSPPNCVTLKTLTFEQKYPGQSFLMEVLEYTQPNIETEPDVARELAVVDELIRTHAENLIDSPLSPSSNTSTSSNFDDSSSDDPEWIPETVDMPFIGDSKSEIRKRKPYSRPLKEDRKSRKKEQNKNAATRYRMKKKAEVEVILKEEEVLAKDKENFVNQIKELQREIKYLKSLMRDVFKAKGLLN
ncbi:hypothetical protein FQA39_LY17576 [Lamprigera yunnana]|nr:hypothetical protein FQA39_LY17576 [Lamprigera yunnana]